MRNTDTKREVQESTEETLLSQTVVTKKPEKPKKPNVPCYYIQAAIIEKNLTERI